MLQEPLTAVCCCGSMLWKLKMKLCAVMPGAVHLHKSLLPSKRPQLKKKKCNRYQQIFLTFCFNSRSSFHLISQHTFYCVFFSDHFFSPSPHAAVDRILQVMVVAICSLCSFFLTLFNDRVDQLIRCSPVIYLQSLLSIQMTVNTGVSAKGPKYEGTKHGNCSLQGKSR